MKHKTSELTGALLDAAVAAARRTEDSSIRHHFSSHRVYAGACRAYADGPPYAPSTDWAIGGPLIERERINVMFRSGRNHPMHSTGPDYWWAQADRNLYGKQGPTALIAAMRAFVASKLGDEVEIP